MNPDEKRAEYRTPEIVPLGEAIELTGSERGGNRYDSVSWLKWQNSWDGRGEPGADE